jgi:hypothetical protein
MGVHWDIGGDKLKYYEAQPLIEMLNDGLLG